MAGSIPARGVCLAIALLLGCLAAALLSASPANASFGFKELETGFSEADASLATQAGSHPFVWKTKFAINTHENSKLEIEPDGSVRDLVIDLPPGLALNPTAVPTCPAADFLLFSNLEGSQCPDNTALGYTAVRKPGEAEAVDKAAIYNLVPPPGVPARLGFHVLSTTIVLDGGVRPDGEHNFFGELTNIAQAEPFDASETFLWGNPADPAHDAQRGNCAVFGGSCPAGESPRPLITLPASCRGPLKVLFKMRSWQEPGIWVSGSASAAAPTGCSKVSFAPSIASVPTTDRAESPTGLQFDIDIDDQGLTSPTGTAQSQIEKAVVTLPKGVTLNPSIAEGLLACTPAQYAAERADSAPGEGCPQASKVGELEVQTPLLAETLKGAVYVAQPDDPASAAPGAENPFDSLIALYLVIKNPERGILVKQAGKVEPDPRTGQLISIFEDVPQVPFSHLSFRFRSGGRSPLITPPLCGEYETDAVFTPWANPTSPLIATASFQIAKGVDGAPCPPGGTPSFEPGFEAGTLDNTAGAFSPFYMRWTRRDGDQDITRFSSALPPGLTAKLAGTSQCPDAAIAQAMARRGRQELARPSCPPSSLLGRVQAGAGVGSQLTFVEGRLYLAGPYNGAPLSVVAIVPAVAGPFDVGTVVTRLALRVNPRSAEVAVDGAASDPIPHILAGIPLKVRDIRAIVDRPSFTLNPTSCEPFAIATQLWGGGADPFSAADDLPASLAERFQASSCASLAFKPRLSLTLKGGTRRGEFPKLRGLYTPRAGDANLKGLVLRLPHSAFLEQGHFGTICTRVQFAAKACPERAIYGYARAFTPLLDTPLKGPVYLRSSNHNLPDLVATLHGLIDVEAAARIDSAHGGIRATFAELPDAPLTKVIVDMQGGQKGLIVNSTGLCGATHRADGRLSAQNGRRAHLAPPVRALGCHKKRRRGGG